MKPQKQDIIPRAHPENESDETTGKTNRILLKEENPMKVVKGHDGTLYRWKILGREMENTTY